MRREGKKLFWLIQNVKQGSFFPCNNVSQCVGNWSRYMQCTVCCVLELCTDTSIQGLSPLSYYNLIFFPQFQTPHVTNQIQQNYVSAATRFCYCKQRAQRVKAIPDEYSTNITKTLRFISDFLKIPTKLQMRMSSMYLTHL